MSVFSKVYENQMNEIVQNELNVGNRAEMILRVLFYTTVISSFEWKNFPDFINQNPDFIEESLFGAGKIAFFKGDKGEYLVAPCYGNGALMENGLFDRYTMILRNGKQYLRNYDEIELCFNNYAELPSRVLVEEFVEKCLVALRAVDMSLRRAGLPSIVALQDEAQMTAFSNIVKNTYDNSNPFHTVKGDWTDEDLKTLNVYDDKATNILGLWDIFVRYKNLFFTTFGINNVEIVKTERLTQSESQSNTEITRYGMFNDMYQHRRDFCERVKNHFGVNLEVYLNRNLDTVTELNLTEEEKIEMKNNMIAPYKEDGKIETKEEEIKIDED